MFNIFGEIQARRTTAEVIRLLSQNIQQKRSPPDPVIASSSHSIEKATSFDPSTPDDIPPWARAAQPVRKPGSRLGGIKRVAPLTKVQAPKRQKAPVAAGSRCFAVMFAKPQTRKNKTWEDDGYLVLTKDNILQLRNSKGELVTSGVFLSQNFDDGSCFNLGDKMVQVQEELNETIEFPGS